MAIGVFSGTDYDDYMGNCRQCDKVNPLDIFKDVYVMQKHDHIMAGYYYISYMDKSGINVTDQIKMELYKQDGKDLLRIGYGKRSGKLIIKIL